jgi:hypothetical protein
LANALVNHIKLTRDDLTDAAQSISIDKAAKRASAVAENFTRGPNQHQGSAVLSVQETLAIGLRCFKNWLSCSKQTTCVVVQLSESKNAKFDT